MTEIPPLDERKLQLERDRLDLERKKWMYERKRSGGLLGFFRTNMPVVVTAIIGLATVIVSWTQLGITEANNKAQRELDNRKVEVDISKTILGMGKDFDSSDPHDVKFLVAVISALPYDVGIRIFNRMAATAETPELKLAWGDAAVKLSTTSTDDVASLPAGSVPALTVDGVVAQFPELPADGAARVAELFAAAKEFEIVDNDRLAVFLAMVFYETNVLKYREETFNYGANMLSMLRPDLFPTPEDAQALVGHPDQIANALYRGRLGNAAPDDGWRYRGRGYLQMVGRGNYQRLGARVGVNLVAQPDLLSTDPAIAARVAAAYFADRVKDVSDVAAAYRRINGGLNGVSAVLDYLRRLRGLPVDATPVAQSPSAP